MAETPTRIAPTLLTASAAALATAGGASTWRILRSIVVNNEDTAPRTFTLGINTAATDASGKRTFTYLKSIGAGDQWEWSGYLPLIGHASTPDILYGLADVTSKVTVTVGLVDGP